MAKSESAGWPGLLWSRCQLFGIASNAQVVVHGGEAVTATNSLGRRPATCHTVLNMSDMHVACDKSMLMHTMRQLWSTLVGTPLANRTFQTPGIWAVAALMLPTPSYNDSTQGQAKVCD